MYTGYPIRAHSKSAIYRRSTTIATYQGLFTLSAGRKGCCLYQSRIPVTDLHQDNKGTDQPAPTRVGLCHWCPVMLRDSLASQLHVIRFSSYSCANALISCSCIFIEIKSSGHIGKRSYLRYRGELIHLIHISIDLTSYPFPTDA